MYRLLSSWPALPRVIGSHDSTFALMRQQAGPRPRATGQYLVEILLPHTESPNTHVFLPDTGRLSRVWQDTRVTTTLARSRIDNTQSYMPAPPTVPDPLTSTVRTIINFRRIARSLRLPSASSVMTLVHCLVALRESSQDGSVCRR